MDPETEWSKVSTRARLWGLVRPGLFSKLMVRAIREAVRSASGLAKRVAGSLDDFTRRYCAPEEARALRLGSTAILAIHLAVIAAAIAFRTVWPILFVTIAWHVGA